MKKQENPEKKPPQDDGRTVADMDIEGMPWRRKGMPGRSKHFSLPPDLTPSERRAAIRGMMKAVFLIAGAFFVGFLLLFLLLDWLWLR